ncbi:hypothetical protein Leryth_012014 [Lithospermum erythrorhizon]|nr:hypothetical protein Leryth_012014 [Lithospermum erythrorhizon]
MNAWLFVHSEEVPAALNPYRAFQKEKNWRRMILQDGFLKGSFMVLMSLRHWRFCLVELRLIILAFFPYNEIRTSTSLIMILPIMALSDYKHN